MLIEKRIQFSDINRLKISKILVVIENLYYYMSKGLYSLAREFDPRTKNAIQANNKGEFNNPSDM